MNGQGQEQKREEGKKYVVRLLVACSQIYIKEYSHGRAKERFDY